MKYFKFAAALLAALILLLSLISCESGTEPTETTIETTAATAESTTAATTAEATAAGSAEETVSIPITIEDGHTYTTYRRENGELFGVTDYFTITLRDDGQCQYYATFISSYIGVCKYEIKGDILTITDDGIPGLYGTLTNVYKFKIVGDTLVFLADESSEFMYKKLPDGAVFEKKTD